MKTSSYLPVMFLMLTFFAASCAKTSSAPTVEYGQVCTAANNDKEVSVQGFLNVTDKVPCVKMLSPKRDCGFKLMDKINITGTEIIAYLAEGTDKNQAETPDAQKSSGELRPTTVFTRDDVKFRLDDGGVIVPQKDIATPVTVTGKVNFSENGSERLCSIMASRIEKRP